MTEVAPIVVTPKRERSISWTILVILAMGPVLIGTLWWLLGRLTAPQWCAVSINAAKAVGAVPQQTAPDCTTIILSLLEIHRVAIIGLLIAIVVSYLIMVVMVLGAGVRFAGPGDVHLDIGADRPERAGGDQ